MKKIEDPDMATNISSGMLPNATDEDKHLYDSFIAETMKAIHTEMYKEFVTDKYIEADEFERHFADGKRDWIKPS
jgi:hypothetical protein